MPSAETPTPWIIVEGEKADPGNVGVFGPFATREEAAEQAKEWRQRDGIAWHYEVRRIYPPTEWEPADG